jgi:hypothetical protein
MDVVKATKDYEAWLGALITLVPEDVKRKHQLMADALFPFLRATFYRFAQIWPDVCTAEAEAPLLLAVGDLHIENFGTWRDAEGRLVWGINDLDEAHDLPYTLDLVRLAVSALMAIAEGHLKLTGAAACAKILEGYATRLNKPAGPFVLAEEHEWLRHACLGVLRDPKAYWAKLGTCPADEAPPLVRGAIEELLPAPGLSYTVHHRVAGLGSLGRQRFLALADWHGARVAREAKALAPSACCWAHGDDDLPPQYQTLLDHAVRCPDPFVAERHGWIVRRLAPDCSRIELAGLAPERDEAKLLADMGAETANVHMATPAAIQEVCADLAKRPNGWLLAAAAKMEEAVKADWKAWRKAQGS